MREPDLTKKRNLVKILKSMGCIRTRSGKHEWRKNPITGKGQAVPHGRKIDKDLAEHIIKELSNDS